MFGFVASEGPIDAMAHNRCSVELQVQQNMTTSFRPMYYIVGVVAESDLVWLGSAPAKTFEHIFQRLSPSCWFVHCFSKTFQDRLRFCIRKNKTVKSLAADEDQSV